MNSYFLSEHDAGMMRVLYKSPRCLGFKSLIVGISRNFARDRWRRNQGFKYLIIFIIVGCPDPYCLFV